MIIDVSDHFEYNFTRDVVLDQTVFRFIFNWNELFDFWTLEIQDADFQTLWIGKLVCNFDLLHRYRSNSMPAGRIIAETTDKAKEVAQKDDFKNKAVILRYITQQEIESI